MRALSSGKMIKTIFFDIGGVLLDIHIEKTYQFLSDCIDVDKSIIKQRFPWDAHNEYEKGLIDNREWFLIFKDSLPQPCCLKESDFWKAWKLLLGREKGTRRILTKLKSDFSLWLLSNTNPQHIKDEIEKNYTFPKLVDGAIYSFDVGCRKPDKSIYKIAMEQAKIQEPNESLFIDDLHENILGAKSVGMNAIHFRSTGELINKLVDFNIYV